MPGQRQFLDVIDCDEARRRFQESIRREPLGTESVPLADALERILAVDVSAQVDVPAFDRANYDGYAVRAEDTFGADEQSARRLELCDESIATGRAPQGRVVHGTAMEISTGGMLPRGADAVVMVEHADLEGRSLFVRRAVTPGFGVAFAGTDIACGETVLRKGQRLSSRETAVLAAIGCNEVTVHRRPRVAILSTGDEIIAPGQPIGPAQVHDANGQALADAVRELGCVPLPLGIVADQADALRARLASALDAADVVLLSGGTSKGEGDLCYEVVGEITCPGIVAHGVALKPGKPICLASHHGKPVVVLPGFPTSAIFTFHEFVAPVLRMLAGDAAERRATVQARMGVKIRSEIGRTEYMLVHLIGATADNAPDTVGDAPLPLAYPLGKGSGSVTTFSTADGFVTIGRQQELVDAGQQVGVQMIGRGTQPANLIIMGSHCVGLDHLIGRLRDAGWCAKALYVGSTAGLAAAEREECDVAGIHLLDAKTGQYNRPFVSSRLELVPGYRRRQGIVFREGDSRFAGGSVEEIILRIIGDGELVMINRNQGSGTRTLIEQILKGHRPAGYAVQPSSHTAVAAAVVQGRADWGVAIEWVARAKGLGFIPLADEEYDFVVPRSRLHQPAVQAFCRLVNDPATGKALGTYGFSWSGAVRRVL